jgi:dethiobiotin synthetase
VSARIVVTGTDTDVGKTIFSAGLTRFLGASYWKPVQAGLQDETDSAIVRRLSEASSDRIHAEGWRLHTPASPHWSAELDEVEIDVERLLPPASARPLVIEGAGGLLVPLTRTTLQIDVFARWCLPTVLCARTRLGTINHTLLSLEALRARGIPVLGIAFLGDAHPDNERTIAAFGKVPVLGRLGRLDPLTPQTLIAAFTNAFSREAFVGPWAAS